LHTASDKAFENVFCIESILRLATKNRFPESSQRLIQLRLVLCIGPHDVVKCIIDRSIIKYIYSESIRVNPAALLRGLPRYCLRAASPALPALIPTLHHRHSSPDETSAHCRAFFGTQMKDQTIRLLAAQQDSESGSDKHQDRRADKLPFEALRPPVSADLTSPNSKEMAEDGPPKLEKILPSPMDRNVSYKGRMVDGGYEPENHEWDQVLTETVNGKRIGRDPMEIDPEILTAAGHAPRRTTTIGAAIDMPVEDHIKKYRNIREHCIQCSSGNKAEVRRCAIYDCAAWPYRMGKNPHNPRRGKNPFPAKSTNKPSNSAANDNRQDRNEHSS